MSSPRKWLELFVKTFSVYFAEEHHFLIQVIENRAAPRGDLTDTFLKLLSKPADLDPLGVAPFLLDGISELRAAKKLKRLRECLSRETFGKTEVKALGILLERVAHEIFRRYEFFIQMRLNTDDHQVLITLAKSAVARALEYIVRCDLEITSDNILKGVSLGKSGRGITQFFNERLPGKGIYVKEKLTVEGVYSRSGWVTLTGKTFSANKTRPEKYGYALLSTSCVPSDAQEHQPSHSKEELQAYSPIHRHIHKETIVAYIKQLRHSSLPIKTLKNFVAQDYPGIEIVICSEDLSDLDLHGADFTDADFSGALLAGDLNQCCFDSTVLIGATIKSSSQVCHASFRKAHCEYLKAEHVDFTGSDLTQAKFQFAQLAGSTLVDVKNLASDFYEADLTDVIEHYSLAHWWSQHRERHLSDEETAKALSLYVPLNGQHGYEQPELHDAYDAVSNFLDSDQQVFLLLGDAGAGKSTFETWLEQKLMREKMDWIVLSIMLPSIGDPIHRLLDDYFSQVGLFNPSQRDELKYKRNVLLICDGYDEIYCRDNLFLTNRLYEWQQASEGQFKIMIGCRSQYLTQARYQDQFMPYDANKNPKPDLLTEFVLQPFSSTQIESYLKKYIAVIQPRWSDWQRYQDEIDRSHDIRTLAGTPYILFIIAEVLPDIVEEREKKTTDQQQLTRAAIYDAFLDRWFKRSEMKLRESGRLQDPHWDIQLDFREFCKRLATKMFQAGMNIVEYKSDRLSRIYEQGKEHSTWDDFFKDDEKLNIVRMGCPIRRFGPVHYGFNHKSLQEYFGARHLFDQLQLSTLIDSQEKTVTDLNAKLLTNEPSILSFLVDRIIHDEQFEQILWQWIEQSKTDKTISIAAANAITLLNAAQIPFNDRDLSGISVPHAVLSHGIFELTNFRGADLTGVNFENSFLRGVQFDDAVLEDVYFRDEGDFVVPGRFSKVAISPNGSMIIAVPVDKEADTLLIKTENGEVVRLGGTRYKDEIHFSGTGQSVFLQAERFAGTSVVVRLIGNEIHQSAASLPTPSEIRENKDWELKYSSGRGVDRIFPLRKKDGFLVFMERGYVYQLLNQRYTPLFPIKCDEICSTKLSQSGELLAILLKNADIMIYCFSDSTLKKVSVFPHDERTDERIISLDLMFSLNDEYLFVRLGVSMFGLYHSSTAYPPLLFSGNENWARGCYLEDPYRHKTNGFSTIVQDHEYFFSKNDSYLISYTRNTLDCFDYKTGKRLYSCIFDFLTPNPDGQSVFAITKDRQSAVLMSLDVMISRRINIHSLHLDDKSLLDFFFDKNGSSVISTTKKDDDSLEFIYIDFSKSKYFSIKYQDYTGEDITIVCQNSQHLVFIGSHLYRLDFDGSSLVKLRDFSEFYRVSNLIFKKSPSIMAFCNTSIIIFSNPNTRDRLVDRPTPRTPLRQIEQFSTQDRYFLTSAKEYQVWSMNKNRFVFIHEFLRYEDSCGRPMPGKKHQPLLIDLIELSRKNNLEISLDFTKKHAVVSKKYIAIPSFGVCSLLNYELVFNPTIPDRWSCQFSPSERYFVLKYKELVIFSCDHWERVYSRVMDKEFENDFAFFLNDQYIVFLTLNGFSIVDCQNWMEIANKQWRQLNLDICIALFNKNFKIISSSNNYFFIVKNSSYNLLVEMPCGSIVFKSYLAGSETDRIAMFSIDGKYAFLSGGEDKLFLISCDSRNIVKQWNSIVGYHMTSDNRWLLLKTLSTISILSFPDLTLVKKIRLKGNFFHVLHENSEGIFFNVPSYNVKYFEDPLARCMFLSKPNFVFCDLKLFDMKECLGSFPDKIHYLFREESFSFFVYDHQHRKIKKEFRNSVRMFSPHDTPRSGIFIFSKQLQMYFLDNDLTIELPYTATCARLIRDDSSDPNLITKVITGGKDKTVRLWDIQNPNAVRLLFCSGGLSLFVQHVSFANAIGLSDNNTRLLSGQTSAIMTADKTAMQSQIEKFSGEHTVFDDFLRYLRNKKTREPESYPNRLHDFVGILQQIADAPGDLSNYLKQKSFKGLALFHKNRYEHLRQKLQQLPIETLRHQFTAFQVYLTKLVAGEIESSFVSVANDIVAEFAKHLIPSESQAIKLSC